MNDKLKKAAVVSGALLATTAADLLTTSKLLSEAVDRDEPPLIQTLKKPFAAALSDEEFETAKNAAEERLEAMGLQTVEISADDGTRLVGHWYPCEKPERIILACHGWRTTWSHAYGLYTDFWHQQNCDVLIIEQRGQNNSGGDYMGFGLIERFDCLRWAEYLALRTENTLPIYLWGVSMGASTALMASAQPLPECVIGIVADCGFTSVKAIWQHVASDTLHIPFYLRGTLATEMFRRRVGAEDTGYSTLDALKVNTLPIFFAHGEADSFVPTEMTKENYAACTAPKRLFTVPGATHTMSYYAAKDEYEKAIKEFWQAVEDGSIFQESAESTENAENAEKAEKAD